MALEHLDTVIAFAVLMLGASLLITVMTQGVSTLLNLRGMRLSRALGDLLGTLYPEQKDRADAIARDILQHPLLSDSAFGSEKQDPGKYRLWVAVGAAAVLGVAVGMFFDAPLEMVRAGVLAALVVGGLLYYFSRNWELASAVRIEEFFGMMERLGRTHAAKEATAVKLAEAKAPDASRAEQAAKTAAAMAAITRKIRDDSAVSQRLKELEALAERCGDDLKQAADALKSAANDPAVEKLLQVVVAAVAGGEEWKAHFTKLRLTLAAVHHAAADELNHLIETKLVVDASLMTKMQEAAESGLKDLETMFNAAMDRAAQRFVLHSRVWTAVFSFVFAFVCHFDAVALYKKLSSDAELRARLVASSEAMMKQADEILAAKSANDASRASDASTPAGATEKPADGGSTPADAGPEGLVTPGSAGAAPPDAGAAPPDAGAAPPDAGATPPDAGAASPGAGADPSKAPAESEVATCVENEQLSARVPGIYTAAMICPEPLAFLVDARNGGDTAKWMAEKKKLGPFPTREDALDFLEKRPVKTDEERDAMLDQYRVNLGALLQSSDMDQLFDHAASINGQLSRAGIELWPDPYPGWPTRKELPGLLVAAALLSLGAPFWFNILKTLSNLRPLVATREEKERQDKNKPKGPSK